MTDARTARTTREKAAQLRAEAERAQARRRTRVVTAAVAAAVVLVVGAVALVQQLGHQRDVATAAAPGGVPRNVQADGGIAGVLAGASAPPAGKQPVTIELWEDFQCPACRAFEAEQRDTLQRWAKQGVVRIVYKPVAFLDRASTTKYSTRALDAAAAVADSTPSAFPAFHDLLYADQPEEGSAGLTDARLVELAVQAGAPRDAVASALASRRFEGWTVQRTDAFSRAGFTSTPTVVVDGSDVSQQGAPTPEALRAAVAKAAAAKGLPAPN